MSDTPNDLLDYRFREYLRLSAALRPEYPETLGQADGDAAVRIAEIAPGAPELLKVIYANVAGTGDEVEEPSLVEFIPGYRLIHINEYAEQRAALSAMLEERGHAAAGQVYPLLANYSGDFICIWKKEDGTESVCDFLSDYGDVVVMFESPLLFLDTLCEFYKQEVYFVDEDGFLDCDLIKEGEVGAAMNPSANYWSE
ncbi:hypothetical protein [Paenibacillus sp. NFR01]|uniref:hypothetical protein n=1 Tax=Paenibacillus sp. NFR01 TaxID=1566279 RepID=UPI0008C945E5|nr:hypothetical protein [Paenibacillus sp. NFR01]SEU28438.1 hypothetical protein SAMN03159358_4708 [Paenibacillus sp. NFR01]